MDTWHSMHSYGYVESLLASLPLTGFDSAPHLPPDHATPNTSHILVAILPAVDAAA